MSEQWLPVIGFENRYSISDQGRLRSEARTIPYTKGRRIGKSRQWPMRILKGSLDSNGYIVFTLWCNGTPKRHRAHRLVLAAFRGPCPDGKEGLHFDDNKSNNYLTNLRYGTRLENVHDQIRNSRHYKSILTHCPNKHEYTPENTIIRKGGARRCRQCQRDSYKPHPPTPKLKCPQGHDYTPESTFQRADGRRECRVCMRARNRAWYKQKATA